MTNTLIYTYYIWNERGIYSLSNDMFNSEKCCERRKWYLIKYFFYFYFLIVHISTNNALGGLIFSMLVSNIHVEGTQIFVLDNTFYFMPKNG